MNKIGQLIGRVIKLDFWSSRAATAKSTTRGRFARACIEIDITKPLLGVIYIEGKPQRVEYEGLDSICFHCGRYGHRKDSCRELAPPSPPQSLPVPTFTANGIPTVSPASNNSPAGNQDQDQELSKTRGMLPVP